GPEGGAGPAGRRGRRHFGFVEAALGPAGEGQGCGTGEGLEEVRGERQVGVLVQTEARRGGVDLGEGFVPRGRRIDPRGLAPAAPAGGASPSTLTTCASASRPRAGSNATKALPARSRSTRAREWATGPSRPWLPGARSATGPRVTVGARHASGLRNE